MWILTKDSLYYEHGDVFIAAFLEKPSFDQLKEVMDEADCVINDLLEKGSDYTPYRDNWYYLSEYEPGSKY